MEMKKYVVYVEACRECPSYENSDKTCAELNKVVVPDEIDEDCPLEDM